MAKSSKDKKGKKGKGGSGKSGGLKRRQLEQLLAAQARFTQPQGRGQGVLGGLSRLLPKGRTEQFLLGLAIGGGLAYVLSDEQIRGKLFKGALRAYGDMMGGVAEMKEQLADLQAELQAEQGGLV